MALLSLSELKTALGISGSDLDNQLTAIVNAVIARVKTFLGYDPETTSYTDYPNPRGSEVLTLPSAPPNAPVTVSAVYEDGTYPPTFDATTLLTAGEDYAQERAGSATLIRLSAVWPYHVRRDVDRLAGTVRPQIATVKATYTIDNTNVLAAATLAAQLEGMAMSYLGGVGKGIGQITQDSMDGAQVSLTVNARGRGQVDKADTFLSPEAFQLLRDYRRLPLA